MRKKYWLRVFGFVAISAFALPAIAQHAQATTGAAANRSSAEETKKTADSELHSAPTDLRENSYDSGYLHDDHRVFVPLLIEYEPQLEPLSTALAQVLAVRLDKFGVEVTTCVFGDPSAATDEFEWNITLRRISERHLIISIDSTDEQRSVSEVRTVSHNPNVEQLAWTMGLVVEEMVTPYLQSSAELPALGAGLAILEPKEVAGTKKTAPVKRVNYPRFYGLGLGLMASGIWSIDEILTGPKLSVKGIFSKRTVAMFTMGWQGSANYGARTVTGSMSQIPIELYFGNIFFQQRVLKIVGWAGFSLGFAVYKSHSLNSTRTDMTFQPGGNLLIELVAVLVSPLEFFLQGGCNFPFVRDVLVNNGTEVYSHVWVVPTITLGLQLGF
ncbi:MAG: hypothetical protein JXX29_03025 [Deltaproteobacteria bacterium]|nr:hypothetical protein [Deltaproteobacteria bacterium]MBN2670616.1 hypothetical protein [Deltaproteobacteria bacterium]